ncbi:calyx/pep [Cryptophlebia peltastica nucleopolyhedrovirus]|uniref:Calyx/pep n=1 Tax=Cryptophlebia peltastica nucleopolyhedrovirus TaxID=2304025 RepID=A0A346RNW0_9ABAC|nr:calyx/pep [Cryptophlebia peltastica nucleopolyhedrovirus]AXS67757.1 calyx/pep [Cryptophlebia peltastica nucleopolyhedrovirus]
MSVSIKKVQDYGVPVLVDPVTWTAWVGADEVLNVLRLPSSVLQSIPLRHKKCWLDFRGGFNPNNNCNVSCRWDTGKLFIDLYGLGLLCGRVNSSLSDYLMTQFVGEIYRDYAPDVLPQPQPPLPFPVPPQPPVPPPGNLPLELLERLNRQSDLIINALSQLSISNSNQHLEITNQLNAIRLQNVTITGQLTSILDILENQLGNVTSELNRLLTELDGRFDSFVNTLNSALSALQDSVRNELTTINSILSNLTSTVTNLNSTLTNLLQAISNLNLGDLSNEIESISTTVDQILSILTPEIQSKKA